MNRWPLIFLVGLGAILYLFYLQSEHRVSERVIGKSVSDFELVSLEGQKIRLSDFKGQVVLVHFWATWCPPCAQEIPSLNKLYNKMRQMPEGDFVLLAISMDERSEDVANFKKRVPFDFPVYFDPTFKIADEFGTFGLPETFFLDRKGDIAQKIIGPQNWENRKWYEEYKKL